MQQKKGAQRSEPQRLAPADMLTIEAFTPWQIRCKKCSELAYLMPQWTEMRGDCRCGACGATYSVALSRDHARRFVELPLWLKANFRKHVFWALNVDHLGQLERVIRSTLRERPVINRRRMPFTTRMPFNLPSWMLSAKNREDLLQLIKRLRKTVR